MSEPNRITEALAPALDLDLYHLESGLAGLIEYREERISDTENPPDAEELAALDAEIQRYEIATPAKVSGVAAVVRNWRAKVITARAEIDRLKKIAAHYEAMEARLKDYVGSILERQPMPKKGCRKLTGSDGSQLILKGNGGLQPLEITDPAMVPDDCVRLVGSIPLLVWRALLDEAGIDRVRGADFLKTIDNAAIREALAQPCPVCEGTGDTLDASDERGSSEPCPTCGGSGKNAVPGARLLERGSHVEVR